MHKCIVNRKKTVLVYKKRKQENMQLKGQYSTRFRKKKLSRDIYVLSCLLCKFCLAIFFYYFLHRIKFIYYFLESSSLPFSWSCLAAAP